MCYIYYLKKHESTALRGGGVTSELGDRVFKNNIYNLTSIVILKKENKFQTYPLVKSLKKSAQKGRIEFT